MTSQANLVLGLRCTKAFKNRDFGFHANGYVQQNVLYAHVCGTVTAQPLKRQTFMNLKELQFLHNTTRSQTVITASKELLSVYLLFLALLVLFVI